MPREIVTLQVGQCGNQMGSAFWNLLLQEMKANAATDDATSSMFYTEQHPRKQLKARCIPIDTEEGVLSAMLRGPLHELFDAAHFISDVSGAGNNWAVGHIEYGDRYLEDIHRSVASMVEKCESLQAFLVMHSLGGGTGSGLGTRVLGMLEDEYPNVFRFCPVVMPSEVDDVVIGPYNSCFALRELIDHADCVIPFDNDALAAMANKSRGAKPNDTREAAAPSQSQAGYSIAQKSKLPFDTMNSIVAQMLSNLTCGFRFPGPLNLDVNEITTNMVPYPRLHFLLSSLAPLSTTKHVLAGPKRLDAMFSSACFEADHQLVSCTPWTSTYLACAAVVRGAGVSVANVTRNLARVKEKMHLVYWNNDGFKTAISSVPPHGHTESLLMMSNNCAIGSKLGDLRDRFMKLYSVRAHVHHYDQYLELSYFDGTMETINSVVDDYAYLNTVQPPPNPPRSFRDLLV